MFPVWLSISVAAVTNAQAAVRSRDRWRPPCPELSIACAQKLGVDGELSSDLNVNLSVDQNNATNEPGNESANPYRRAAAGGVLRIPFLLWPRGLRPARRRRTPLRAGGARNARALRLGDAYAAKQSVARKACAVFLAGDAFVPRSRRHRPRCPSARGL